MEELTRTTNQRAVHPQMLSGHIQGRFLGMLVRMLRPHRVLEIGTFTGYSALSMAAGMGAGAILDTIEADDEQEELIRSFVERSGYGDRIRKIYRKRKGLRLLHQLGINLLGVRSADSLHARGDQPPCSAQRSI